MDRLNRCEGERHATNHSPAQLFDRPLDYRKSDNTQRGESDQRDEHSEQQSQKLH
jgi:hypothetical protein